MASASAPAGPAAANPADAPPSPATERAQQAALPYTWTQTLADVDISFNVLPRLRGRDIDVRIARNTLHAGVRGEGAVVEVSGSASRRRGQGGLTGGKWDF